MASASSTIVRSRRKAKTAVEQARELVARYAPLIRQVKEITETTDELKKSLVTLLVAGGEPDEKGSRWIELGEPIEGVRAIKHEIRRSTYLDVDKALRVLTRKAKETEDDTLIDDCTLVQVSVRGDAAEVQKLLEDGGYEVQTMSSGIDQDAVMTAYAAKRLTQRDVNAMMSRTENFAFKVIGE